ncbi:MAG: LLM class F420-dependent oxidoreductase [Dehalococcoidia bacterium]
MPDFGVFMFATDYAIPPAELAMAAEERGFESIFFPEHTHIPSSRRTPWPGGSDLPKEYWHTHDPFIALTAAAAVTERIKLATGICLIPEHDPIALAKTLASLDMLSNGRVILGIGAGWNVEELEHHGSAFKDRWKVTRERILAMRELWTKEEAEFHGEFVDFESSWSYPKPVQPGGPPVLLGATSKWAYDRVVDYCDGWMPIIGRADMREAMERMRAAADRGGRSMDTIQLTAFGAPNDEKGARELLDLGFQRLVFGLPPAPADVVLPLLDQYAGLAKTLA